MHCILTFFDLQLNLRPRDPRSSRLFTLFKLSPNSSILSMCRLMSSRATETAYPVGLLPYSFATSTEKAMESGSHEGILCGGGGGNHTRSEDDLGGRREVG